MVRRQMDWPSRCQVYAPASLCTLPFELRHPLCSAHQLITPPSAAFIAWSLCAQAYTTHQHALECTMRAQASAPVEGKGGC